MKPTGWTFLTQGSATEGPAVTEEASAAAPVDAPEVRSAGISEKATTGAANGAAAAASATPAEEVSSRINRILEIVKEPSKPIAPKGSKK